MRVVEFIGPVLDAIHEAWCAETAAPGTLWTPDVPSRGQCAVTALLLRDWLGGEILRADVDGAGHYWNRIPGMGEIDLTRDQFAVNAPIGRGLEVPVERLTDGPRAEAARTAERYELLLERATENYWSALSEG